MWVSGGCLFLACSKIKNGQQGDNNLQKQQKTNNNKKQLNKRNTCPP
jgi:hypothetical protein